MKIVSLKICPYVQRVVALLEIKKVPYDVEYINFSDPPQWFLDASPNSQVPILFTNDGRVIFESDAIVEYLDEAVGEPTLSRDLVEKAQDRAWSYLATSQYMTQCGSQRSSTNELLDESSAKLSKAFAKIAARLGDKTFAHGDKMGAIDIAWLPVLHRAAIIESYSGYDYLEAFPSLKRWQKAIMDSGIPEKSVSSDFESIFTSFYLAESTYLGQMTREKIGKACCGDPECKVEDLACCS